ncbi:MAG: zinc-ribbon domain-containing protein [Ruminococcus sp.]|nr:zinc-ribbon domain-containing protein [Ruminococcus sp.]
MRSVILVKAETREIIDMKCPNCGQEIADGSKFCIFCGTVVEEKKPEPVVEPAPEPVAEPAPEPVAEPAPEVEAPKMQKKEVCSNCGQELAPGAVFCTNCGTKKGAAPAPAPAPEPKKAVCANCGAELKPGMKFCTNCGTKVGEAAPKTVPTPPPAAPKAAPKYKQLYADLTGGFLTYLSLRLFTYWSSGIREPPDHG